MKRGRRLGKKASAVNLEDERGQEILRGLKLLLIQCRSMSTPIKITNEKAN